MRMFLVARSLWTKRFFSRYIIPHAIWAAHSLRSLWEISDWWSIKRSSRAPICTNSCTCKTTKSVCYRAIIKRRQVVFNSFLFCLASFWFFVWLVVFFGSCLLINKGGSPGTLSVVLSAKEDYGLLTKIWHTFQELLCWSNTVGNRLYQIDRQKRIC